MVGRAGVAFEDKREFQQMLLERSRVEITGSSNQVRLIVPSDNNGAWLPRTSHSNIYSWRRAREIEQQLMTELQQLTREKEQVTRENEQVLCTHYIAAVYYTCIYFMIITAKAIVSLTWLCAVWDSLAQYRVLSQLPKATMSSSYACGDSCGLSYV